MDTTIDITGESVSYQLFDPNGNALSGRSSYIFNQIKESDSGVYSCQVSVSDASSQVFGCALEPINVVGEINLRVTVSHSRTVTAGSPYTLSCSVSGANLNENGTTAVYTWTKRGAIVQVPSSSNVYIIPSVQVSNAGDEYTCHVEVSIPYYDLSGPFSVNGTGRPLSVTSNNH